MSPSDTGANPGNCFCNWALIVDEEEQRSSTCVCGQRRTRSGAAGSARGAERTAAHRPTHGQGAPEAHFFHLWPLLNLNFPLFWGNRELCFVISESPSSVSSIFCSLPPRLSPTFQGGGLEPTERGEVVPSSDSRWCWQMAHFRHVDLASELMEDRGATFPIIREGGKGDFRKKPVVLTGIEGVGVDP